MRSNSGLLRWFALLATVWSMACAPPPVAPPPKTTPEPPPPAVTATAAVEAPLPPDPGTILPVTENEPSLGDPLAPVTWVVWADYESEQSAALFSQIERLRARFGPDKLRVAWRHHPLSSHEDARTLAIAAQTVFKLGGAKAFWSFTRLALANQKDFARGNLTLWAAEAGVSVAAFSLAFEAEEQAAKIDEDLALAKKLGVKSTPTSFINGTLLHGAQPEQNLAAAIEARLAEAKELEGSGVPAQKIYATAVEKNFTPPGPDKAPPDTTTVWSVPVGKSPVRGKPTALVTIVMFTDFECEHCRKAQKTMDALQAAYGDKLRLVAKMDPILSHPRAEPAATFALEARKQGGDTKFWEANKLLDESPDKLGDDDLWAHAATLKLDVAAVKAAVQKHSHEKELDADLDLASDLAVTGAPHFFINGRRIIGNQAQEVFQKMIDEEIVHAEALLAAGTKPAKLYDEIQKSARLPPDPERVVVPDPTSVNPEKGAKAGPGVVTVQVFLDFQCPHCKGVMGTLDQLVSAYPGKLRLVFRHLPLSMHAESKIAAEASVEAFAQKGSAGFWAFAALLFADQSAAALGKEGLLKSAAKAGLDVPRMLTALENHTHAAEVKVDTDLASYTKITGTPAIAVGDYYVGGNRPLRVFKRAVDRAMGKSVPPKAESIHGYVAPVPPAGTPGLFGASHILVQYRGSMRAGAHVTRTKAEAKKRAEEVRTRSQKGARFEDLVVLYSDEPGAAARGGSLGTFPKGRMVPEFQAGLEATTVGKISAVVESPFGFHVILRTQ